MHELFIMEPLFMVQWQQCLMICNNLSFFKKICNNYPLIISILASPPVLETWAHTTIINPNSSNIQPSLYLVCTNSTSIGIEPKLWKTYNQPHKNETKVMTCKRYYQSNIVPHSNWREVSASCTCN